MSIHLTRQEEELLEAVWSAREKGDTSLDNVRLLSHVTVDEHLLDRIIGHGLVARAGNDLALTPAGNDKARMVIRRHRLAERLLHDVLAMRLEDAESGACEFEHILAPGVTDGICTLLGHPRECPHGSPIPEGACCQEVRRQVASIVFPLTELKTGETARIAYITTTHHPRLHKLLSFGISPGSTVKIHQKFPSLIIQSEHTELALEESVARDIFVRRDR
jgi:DtxR family Mn-dependent transcriptional regulator